MNDTQLANRLIMDITRGLYFDPRILMFLLYDLIKRGKVKDNRKGIRVIDFSGAMAKLGIPID